MLKLGLKPNKYEDMFNPTMQPKEKNKMKRIIITLITLFLSSSLCTAQRVPGTKVSLNPPPGFVKAVQFPGYIMKSIGSSIMISEVPGPFTEISRAFTKTRLATRGMTLIEKREVKVAPGNAILLHVSQSANGIKFLKWILAFGNNKESVLIVATFPKQFERDFSDNLKKAILSAKWNRSIKVDFFEGLTFRVKESGDLHIANKIGNSIVLTHNGIFPPKSKGDPVVIIGSSITQSWSVPGNKKEFAKKRLAQTVILLNPKVTSEKRTKIDGLDAYLIEAEGKDKYTGEKLYIMQCLLFTSNGYYIFQGVVNSLDKEKYHSVFTSILNSFQRVQIE